MKMTNEEIGAFYSLYYGTKTGMCGDNIYRKVGVSCDIWDIDYLELRSVEQMTDDELVEVAKTTERFLPSTPLIGQRVLGELGLITHFKDGTEIFFTAKYTVETIDYLRSIGILVPFRQFTPEMLIAEGVVKLKGV